MTGNPQPLTCNSYMNFLRYYKTQHPRLGLRKILQNAFKRWIQLDATERNKFKQKNGRAGIRPHLKWPYKNRLRKIPRQRMPTAHKRRRLNAQKKNIQRRRRNIKRLRSYRP